MKISVEAKNGVEARSLAEERYPKFYYQNSKKIAKDRYLITMSFRKTERGITMIPEYNGKLLKINNVIEDFKKTVKDIVTMPIEEKELSKEINRLIKNIQKIIID